MSKWSKLKTLNKMVAKEKEDDDEEDKVHLWKNKSNI